MRLDKQIAEFEKEYLLLMLIGIELYDLTEVEAWINDIRIALSNHTFKDIGSDYDEYMTTKRLGVFGEQLKKIDYETLREIFAERIILTAIKSVEEFERLDTQPKATLNNLIQKYKDFINNTFRDDTVDIVQQALLEMGM